ncbi:homoserine kinase [Bryobacter aggregatus]|uniref:homoserine kinase n=1 Tax=Bryobacter aggregatus TaxID=360054 RepID=UPI000A9391DB|nr:homoserine kinase [Bryobacter aggregatus]
MASWWRLRVPASSANLGPGFDSLGLALSLYLHCRFRTATRLTITVSGRDAESISTGEDNLIWQTALRVARELGQELPPIELEIVTEAPLGKGLGSSASAITAGVLIADAILGLKWKNERILDVAASIEGHPDNVAACILGSVVASAVDSEGTAHAVRLEMPLHFEVAVVVPDYPLPTHKARAALPDSYSRADAIFNIQRASLLIAALSTGTASAFPTALEDRIHQPYRAALVPGLEEILRLRAPGLLGCCLSGAGPSILVFLNQGRNEVTDAVTKIFAAHGHGAEILDADVDREGCLVWQEGAA